MGTTYYIKGMHCENCPIRIRMAVAELPGIKNVQVDLGTTAISFEGNNIVFEALTLKVAEAGDYELIHSKPGIFTRMAGTLKKFRPLIFMFSLVTLWTILAQVFDGEFSVHATFDNFMGAYFVLFGGLKVINFRKFADSYAQYDLIASNSRIYALVYPLIELSLGVMFLFGFWHNLANIITLVLMTEKAWSVHRALSKGAIVQCACLGGFFNIPVTKVTFYEDLLMAFMAIVSLIFYS